MGRPLGQITIGRLMAATAVISVPLAWLELPALLALAGLGLVVLLPVAMTPPGRRIEVASWASVLQPLVILAYLYATWIAAWCVLGHRPRPSLDDPKYIGPVVNLLYDVFIQSVLFGLIFSVVGCVLTLLCVDRRADARPLLAFLLAWGVFLLILICDPFYVAIWYAD